MSLPSSRVHHSLAPTPHYLLKQGGVGAWRKPGMPENMEVKQHFARGHLSFPCREPIHAAPDLVAKTILDVGFLD